MLVLARRSVGFVTVRKFYASGDPSYMLNLDLFSNALIIKYNKQVSLYMLVIHFMF